MDWLSFIFGFLSAIFTNKVYAMLTRILPDKWARYEITIGEIETRRTLTGYKWIAPIRIDSPKWYRRMLMPPLTEYLNAYIVIDNQKNKVMAVWDKGDMREISLRADGVRSIPIVIVTSVNSTLYLNSGEPKKEAMIKDAEKLSIYVEYSVDHRIADTVSFPIEIKNGEAIFGNGERL